jgi:hypothetical protein
MSNQPVWKLVANIGDVNPLEHGGLFVYRDESGVYCEEAERLRPVSGEGRGYNRYRSWRFCLEKCTYWNGIVSDNKFHPETPAWFAQPEYERKNRPQDTTYLKNVSDHCGYTVDHLIEELRSSDPCRRANAYREIFDYHGWDNADSCPLTLTREDCVRRYEELGLK